MKTEDEMSTAESSTTKKKGWRDFTWDDPGEWKHDPVKKLSYCSVPIGVGDLGAAGKVLVVKFEPGAVVPPHYHDSDYCSMIVDGSIEKLQAWRDAGDFSSTAPVASSASTS